MLDTPGQADSPAAQAIIRRILLQRTDLLAKYGPEKVGAAVDEVADFVGDVEEIGSSDVSGWIRHVEQMLGNMAEGVAEGSLNEFAPGDSGHGDDRTYEYEVYQCNPNDEFDWIGGAIYKTNSMDKAHDIAYKFHEKHPGKAFMIWQERSQGSVGGYGIKDDEQGVAEGSSGVSVRQWANQVRKDHGPDVKFRNRQEGGGAVDSVIAKNSQGETVGVYNRKTGYPTVYEPKQGVAEAQNDYFKRRKDEEDRISGTKAPAKRTPKQTDYEKKRRQQSVAEMSSGSVATVVNPTPKNKAKVGSLFGGTYKQAKAK
jgi:hypothetical protein